ncbi:hypothetical protein HYDPIDRAFT_131072 [Hydnomerulius pinastri MD-312]|nr:hypothetical protein HYDPIDRAFT_131072 [Hydnomerulius pinastri MD-312]
MSSVQIQDCIPTFKVKPSYETPRVIEFLNLKLKHPSVGEVGVIHAVKIHRSRAGDGLLEALDAESDELMRFGTTVIDKRGLIRPWLVDNDFHKGTGCWGREMDEHMGPIVYITHISVEKPELRNEGIGSAMLNMLLSSDHVPSHGYAVCWPTPLFNRALPMGEVEYKTTQDRLNHFFRINGFRRIGRTQFFAYSADSAHPSRRLPVEDDIDPEPAWNSPTASPSSNSFHPPAPEILPALHTAIANNKTPSIVEIIQTAFAADPNSLSEQDRRGFQPIHIAVVAENLPAVRALLSLGAQRDLFKRDNADSLTPLELCASAMRSTREFSETLLDIWDGYSDGSLMIKAALKRGMGLDMPGSDEEYARQKKYGCSCGKCVEGWLSPRMQFRLQADAAFTYDMASDMLRMGLPSFRPREVLSAADIVLTPAMAYIPRELLTNLYQTFYKGYIAVFKGISSTLQVRSHGQSTSPIPVHTAVRIALLGDPAVDFYLQKGGRIEFALDAVTHGAKEQSPLGDGEFDALWEDDTDESGRLWNSLPKCRNDLEFDLVRRQLGLDPTVRWGPYSLHDNRDLGGVDQLDSDDDDDDDDDMQEDDDSDDDEMHNDEMDDDEDSD